MLLITIEKKLQELSSMLALLSNKEYCNPCKDLSNATIGEHVRHIIELFQCLQNQYDDGNLNYDNRKRDYLLETNTKFAQECIAGILKNTQKPNKNLQLKQVVYGEEILIDTNYHRELLYNLEHCIHHQALIKVAVKQLTTITLDHNFGVASATIEYRKQCAQ